MSINEELFAAARRATHKDQCKSVLIAPDQTGESNWHSCYRVLDHEGPHYAGSQAYGIYEWVGDGTYGGRARESGIVAAPEYARPKLHYVARDGVKVSPYFVDENDAFRWLLDHQGQSIDWATKHGGYSFVSPQ